MTVRLVSSIDQGSGAETAVSRAPQTTVSVVDHPSDTTVTHVSCMNQDSVSAADCNSVFGAGFSGKQVLELWPILFGDVVSPKRPTVAPIRTTVARLRNHDNVVEQTFQLQESLVKRTTTVFSCTRPEAHSTCNPVEPAESDGLNETFGDPGTRGHHNYPRRRQQRRSPEAVTEHGDSQQDVAPRRGAMSCRRRGRVGFSNGLDTW